MGDCTNYRTAAWCITTINFTFVGVCSVQKKTVSCPSKYVNSVAYILYEIWNLQNVFSLFMKSFKVMPLKHFEPSQRLRNHTHKLPLFHLKKIQHPNLSRSQFQKHLWATPANCWKDQAVRKMPQYHPPNDLPEKINNVRACVWLYFFYFFCN